MIAPLKDQSPNNLAEQTYKAMIRDSRDGDFWNGCPRMLSIDAKLNWRDIAQGITVLLNQGAIQKYNGGYKIKTFTKGEKKNAR